MYTERRGERTARWINAVADKLGAEGMTKSNYNRGKARLILKRCVISYLLIEVLVKYESEIKERLQ